MIISYQPVGRCLWHVDCTNHFGGIMKEIKESANGDNTLMECLHCGKKGYYPHGKVGRVECAEVE